jgi:hypothetical protein
MTEDGRIFLRPLNRSIESIFGMVEPVEPPSSDAQINAAIASAVAQEVLGNA